MIIKEGGKKHASKKSSSKKNHGEKAGGKSKKNNYKKEMKKSCQSVNSIRYMQTGNSPLTRLFQLQFSFLILTAAPLSSNNVLPANPAAVEKSSINMICFNHVARTAS